MLEPGTPKHVNVDEILEQVTGPRGLWQILILLTICSSMSLPVLFPVFANAVPRYRCALNEAEEKHLAKMNLTFDRAAREVGPWFTSGDVPDVNQRHFGCSRYKNVSIVGSSLTHGELTEPCIKGYVYEPLESQYPSSIVSEWNLVCEDTWKAPFATTIYMFGMLVGFLSGGSLSSRLGRMKAIYIAAIAESAFGVSVTFAQSYEAFVILRFILAAACTIQIASTSVIFVEMTTAPNRAIFSSAFAFFFQCFYRALHAVLAMHIQNWRYLHLAIMAPGVLGLLTLLWIPESPRWLVSQNKDKKALHVLYKAYKVNSICKGGHRLTEEEFLEKTGYSNFMEETLKLKKEFNFWGGLKSFLKSFVAPYQTADLAKRSIICTAMFFGQVCAFFGLLFYTRVIRLSVYYVSMINAATSVPGVILSTVLYSKLRTRKKPLLAMYATAAIILLIGSCYTTIAKPESDVALIVCCNAALILLGASMNMLFIYTPELFPSSIRSQGFGNATGLGRLGSMLCSFINQLDSQIGHGVPVIIYGGVLVLVVVLTCCLSDTSGENLADVVEKGDKE